MYLFVSRRGNRMISRTPIRRTSAKDRRERASGEAVKVYPDGREYCTASASGLREYKARTYAMADRQEGRCAICGFHFDGWFGDPTFDHESGRTAGHKDERIEVEGVWHNAALHYKCNSIKGSKKYAWVDGKYVPKGDA
jgi:hypothetical protein